MKVYHIVIDTSVFVAALRSKRGASWQLFLSLGDPRLKNHVSSPLLYEYEEVALRQQTAHGLNREELNVLLDQVAAESRHEITYYSWRPHSTDPDDDFLVDLAVASGCGYIVTHNTRDFANQFGIAVVTPGDLLRKLKAES